jgi:hypothetical protein
MENIIATKKLNATQTREVLKLRDEYVIRTITKDNGRPTYYPKYYSTEKGAMKMFNALNNM